MERAHTQHDFFFKVANFVIFRKKEQRFDCSSQYYVVT